MLGRRSSRDTFLIGAVSLELPRISLGPRSMDLGSRRACGADERSAENLPGQRSLRLQELRVLEIASLVTLLIALSFWWKDRSPQRLRDEVDARS